MSNITDWIKYELYPALFNSIDTVLPEFSFKRHSGGWGSGFKIDLTTPKERRADKTVVTKKAPGLLLEQGGEVISLIDYTMRRDGVEFIQAVKTLANVVGLQLPKGEFNQESYQRYRDQAALLEDCNSYFIYCLENSKGAEEVGAYLSARGYSGEEIKAMELGYIPSQDKLFKYLLSKGYSQSLIEGCLKLNTGIGSTHRLTIPYRSGGAVKGFKIRTTGEATPKYLNSTGLDRLGGFFNLSGLQGDKDVVIVEGELDSLSATAKGVENVVAIGGSSISSEQVRDAIKRGAKSFTICLDTEPGKREETVKKVNTAIEVILGDGVNRIYIVTLPDLGGPKTDPDRLIKEKGIEVFIAEVKAAYSWYSWELVNIFLKYNKGELTSRDLDKAREDIVKLGLRIADPIQRAEYIQDATQNLRDWGVTKETLSITLDRLNATRDREAQDLEFKRLINEADRARTGGDLTRAVEILEDGLRGVRLKDKATEFSGLLVPVKEEEIRKRQANKPESLRSGYKIGEEELLLPSGAITILAAPTSHGKTTFLINLALNAVKAEPTKEVYFFSYEEDGDAVTLKTLNAYIGQDISRNNRRSIASYFSTGSTDYIGGDKAESFIRAKDSFFTDYINSRRLSIHYTSYNADTLVDAIRYLHKNGNPGAIFIDYMQLLHKGDRGKNKYNSRQEELKQICLDLKDVAVDTGLPIILGAQFNREVVNQLKLHATKIGEAGDIERIANLIVGFWNNDFKPLTAINGEEADIANKNINVPGTIYTEVLKNRDGRVGLSGLLQFNGNTGQINNTQGDATYNPF